MPLLPCEDTARRWPYIHQEGAHTDIESANGFPTSGTVRNKSCLSHPLYSFFGIAADTDKTRFQYGNLWGKGNDTIQPITNTLPKRVLIPKILGNFADSTLSTFIKHITS